MYNRFIACENGTNIVNAFNFREYVYSLKCILLTGSNENTECEKEYKFPHFV